MPKKILLADDSITIQKVVELTFSDGDYEVTAVNNGAKAVQKLAEMRPDIILSDIIMPEKNGYEVCEYVKSHPEYRHLPVILLTGTFEPFDPDRAEKAGCDAVVTKPFESQSRIQKVEELIAQADSEAKAAAPAPQAEPAPSPWAEEPEIAAAPPAAAEPFTHDADVFNAPPPEPAPEMSFDQAGDSPFGAPPDAEQFSGETRAFPKMSFEELQQMAGGTPPASDAERQPEPPAAPEASPWDQPDAAFSGETRAFTKMSFDDLPPQGGESQPEAPAESPLGASPAADDAAPEQLAFSADAGRTPDFSSDNEQPSQQQTAPEPSPWDEETPAYAGETPTFPKTSFDAEEHPKAEASPWDEPEAPAYAGETRAFPKMSFEEMQRMASGESQAEPASQASAEPQPEAQSAAPWDEQPAPSSWSPAAEPPAEPAGEEMPFGAEAQPEPERAEPRPDEIAAGAAAAADAGAEPEEPAVPQNVIAPEAPSIPIAARNIDLNDEQIDRIARRVVELMSEQVIRNIAWEVIPDLAEMVVKERIRQLESEA